MKIFLGDPVLVSQAPPSVRGWGPWQFPLLLPLADGRLLLEYHQEADSARAYGLPVGQRISADDGGTWAEPPQPGITAGLRLPNGDELRAVQVPSVPAAGLDLPRPLAHLPSSYAITYTYYRWSELPVDLRKGWRFQRKLAGSTEWVAEQARVEIPEMLVYTTEDVFVFPFFEQDRIRLTPDGRLLATLYCQPQVANGRVFARRFLAMLLESLDGGRVWRLKSTLPYRPNPQADPAWDARDGFTEPQVAVLPDGSLVAFLRTTDGGGVGPLYQARSLDGGSTWSKPTVFDRFGVWPQVQVLANGVTLAAYGRPGLFLRAAFDPAGQRWGRRTAVVPPGELGMDTCSYASLLALPDGGALIAYSDFNVPDAQGRPRKSILVRRVEVR